ncbi:MAG: tetratricopeptide repeat protein [Desulfobacteraceae bacterium]|nr:MAG: tetratricopeptide repeat protein [Desulfobacteraceae bacterium]
MASLNSILKTLETQKSFFGVFIFVFVSILIFQNNNLGFNTGHHGFLSSHGAALAKNLTSENNYLMFESAFINEKEEISYQTYSRFPVTAFLIIKFFMSFYSSNLSMEILIARQLMNLFYIGAMLFAAFSAYELTRSHISAIVITLFSFSSFYMNYYNDMIFNDTPTLFGFVMTFHGVVIYHLYNRKKQLLFKSVIGLFIGWHIFSMLLAYIVISLAFDLYQHKSIIRLLKSDQVKLGFVSLFVGLLMLAFNFTNETFVTGKPLSEIGSFQSAKSRIGQDDIFQQQYGDYLKFGAFTKEQLHRIGAMSIPYLFKKSGNFKAAGVFILLITFCSCVFLKNRILLFTLLLSGFFWAYPMRGYTFSHDYQSIYYIGIPLVLFLSIITVVQKKITAVMPLLLVCAIIVFVLTNLTFNQSKAKEAQKPNLLTNDFQNIIDYTKTGNIFFIDGSMNQIASGYHAVEFYLSGNFFTLNRDFAEYIISRNEIYNDFPLTQTNSNVFLFQGNPHFAPSYSKRGMAYFKKGDYQEAIADFSQSLQKDPKFAEAYVNRGIARKKMKNYQEAIEDYHKALEFEPESAEAMNNLAWLLSTCPDPQYRDGKQAIKIAKKGNDLNPGAYMLDTLAAAYAENGNFKTAIEMQEEAIRILEKQGKLNLIRELENHLSAYKREEAWRE